MAIEHSKIPGVGETAGSFQGKSSKQSLQMLLSPWSLKVPQKTQLRGARKSIRLTDKYWQLPQYTTGRKIGLLIMKAC